MLKNMWDIANPMRKCRNSKGYATYDFAVLHISKTSDFIQIQAVYPGFAQEKNHILCFYNHNVEDFLNSLCHFSFHNPDIFRISYNGHKIKSPFLDLKFYMTMHLGGW